ncbi:MAG: hypothetical protein OHK0045_19880 [Raineya sp.]
MYILPRLAFVFVWWLASYLPSFAQNQDPLQEWLGIWKGNLQIYSLEGKKQVIPMELHILPTDTAGRYTWKILYDKSPRNYTLIAQDASKGLYLIDEKNGIILENQLFANTFFGCFEVMGNLLTSTYRLEGKQLIFEIFSMSKKKLQKTGNIPEKESPEVIIYPSQVMQKAILTNTSKQKSLPKVKGKK